MFTIRNPKTLRKKIISLKKKGKRVGLVPTMGFLHEGHLSLVRRARKECDFVIVSIFINPTQFGPSEDFLRYPRDIKRDKRILKKEKADFLFLPSNEAMYKEGHSVVVEEYRISKILCGKFRPGHFRGVLTIVSKLFNIALPDRAYFGQKDLQQAYLIKKMVDDLDFPIQIVIFPIVREKSGLAMSSRNTYLTDKEKKLALVLKRSLDRVVHLTGSGIKDTAVLKRSGRLILKCGTKKIDYIQIVTLPEFHFAKRIEKGRTYAVLCAAYVGRTRLIDNRIFKG
ncbi:MAG: pantoate--beta-alanine ligase [Candidatus Aureabacteria bacterium]|nr:pantoate--beta-alanine ligase [Candidatus Auribacterota bacterium]